MTRPPVGALSVELFASTTRWRIGKGPAQLPRPVAASWLRDGTMPSARPRRRGEGAAAGIRGRCPRADLLSMPDLLHAPRATARSSVSARWPRTPADGRNLRQLGAVGSSTCSISKVHLSSRYPLLGHRSRPTRETRSLAANMEAFDALGGYHDLASPRRVPWPGPGRRNGDVTSRPARSRSWTQ
jgi:hypothetical protein